MQIICGNERLNIENNQSSIFKIFDKINEVIAKKNTVFSHLSIDGQNVYEDHEEYIQERLNQILEVEIVTMPLKKMVWETMESISDYLERAIPALKILIDESYESFSDETWNGIEQLAEGMQWILQFSAISKDLKKYPPYWKEIVNSITECEKGFIQLMEGVEVQDTILISDVLSYEITPAYEQLWKSLRSSLQDEEFLKNAN